MMRLPAPLPEGLSTCFSLADAIEQGATVSRLRRDDLEIPFRGARARVGTDPEGLSRAEAEEADAWRRIRAYAAIMPDHAFFVGPTAALIAGLPLPAGLHRELHVGVPSPRTAPHRPGIAGHRVRDAAVRVVKGVRIADPVATWVSLAPFLDEYDLVAATDYLLRVPRSPGNIVPLSRTAPFATRELLTRALTRRRRKDAPKLRHALSRARTGASSRPETHMRLIGIDAGLPEPELDYDIVVDGGFVACNDMAYPDLRLAFEYDGAVHRDKDRFVHDIDRSTRMHDVGWEDMHLATPHVLGDPDEGARRMVAAYTRRSTLTLTPAPRFYL
ncbi:hypothetical protein DTO57_00710 [Microbacterium sorbitolivorans]|uniref:DUF559 domain-containing protein n=2 Tax=Microbacterium sorbitolivorans TaxID=1867410 RepID=A0A367Y5U5_9MICO|nr:hypothetical protein DTO57_00710 [Microbacterium sorbitolivorans]